MPKFTHFTMLEGKLYFVDRKSRLHLATFPNAPPIANRSHAN